MKARIKPASSVCQDFGYFQWPGINEDKISQVFNIVEQNGENVKLKAFGFGVIDGSQYSYGCGSLWTNIKSLILII